MSPSIFLELKPLTPLKWLAPKDSEASPKVEVSLIIPAKSATHALAGTVREAHTYLSSRFGSSFEIILVPNLSGPEDQSEVLARQLASELSQIRVILHESPPGKGAALRTGVSIAQGAWIFFTDSDLPYDLAFFDQALIRLRSGFDLVTGNRRLPTSHFHIPVSLLRLAHGRHRLGLGFNRMVRWFFPIQTTDTQAGIKAFSRRLALQAFSRQTCPGFLFDLELLLTAHGQGYGQTDLPVTLHLNSEKSTVRILREFVLVAYWLTRIGWQNQKGHYGKRPRAQQRLILKRYEGADLSTRLFLKARWWLTPYSVMASRLPLRGSILDLGCGHGLLALTAALSSQARQVLAVDHDDARILLAQNACRDLANIRIQKGSVLEPPRPAQPYSAVTAIDVMHYFAPELQEKILKNLHSLLNTGGTLLVREVDPNGGWISKWNRLYEKIATGIGFTQAENEGLHFRTQESWEALLTSIGFKVRSERCSSFLFADILYTCERL